MTKEPTTNNVNRLGKELMELFNTKLKGYVLPEKKGLFKIFKSSSGKATTDNPEEQNVSAGHKHTHK